MLGAAGVPGRKKIGKLFAALGKAALNDGGEAGALVGLDEGCGERRELDGGGRDFRRGVEDGAGERAEQGDLIADLDLDGE